MSTNEELKKATIKTFTGKIVAPLSMELKDIHPKDIVHALQNKCRFTGHTSRFYSVGQHSCIVSEIVQWLYSGEENQSPITLKTLVQQATLHDADEAYLPDIPSPIKQLPEFAYLKQVGNDIFTLVMEWHNLPTTEHPLVKKADRIALALEKESLMNTKTENVDIIANFNLNHMNDPRTILNEFRIKIDKYKFECFHDCYARNFGTMFL